MRVFIGTGFNRNIMNSIAEIQHIVRENSEKGRFKYAGNFHLTFKFLGEVQQSKTVDIGRSLKVIASKHRKIYLNIDKIGYFEGRGSIHALWLGFSGELDKLGALYSDIDEEMYRLGIKKEIKAYTPHITIAQDLVLKIPFEKLKDKMDFQNFGIEIKEISLIKSEEIGGKRIYTPISAFGLK
ncbi:MAG TPA: RNA 2',3'-cyclic phosphodiesterase [Bacillota bacterium]|nr:RNA 2',3'-cyclic phosphodiesterase [Bacillota bacterium]HPL53094.1 RNA 2',3'-cyclic phosphodiesterase [Bacillota bacterium]